LRITGDDTSPIRLRGLAERHHGLTDYEAGRLAEAAEVCLARHHVPGLLDWSVEDEDGVGKLAMEWDGPDGASIRSNANDIDATEAGAYCVVLAVVERTYGLVALRRTQSRTGADWWLVPSDAADVDDPELDLDRDDSLRLEVSGTSQQDAGAVRRRLKAKMEQLEAVAELGPGLAGVVGFPAAIVLLGRVSTDGA
jgi:hypothetical protein